MKVKSIIRGTTAIFISIFAGLWVFVWMEGAQALLYLNLPHENHADIFWYKVATGVAVGIGTLILVFYFRRIERNTLASNERSSP